MTFYQFCHNPAQNIVTFKEIRHGQHLNIMLEEYKNVLEKNLKNFFAIKVREESAYKLNPEMLKAKKSWSRSVEDKKKIGLWWSKWNLDAEIFK